MRSGVFLGLLATLVATAAVRADEVNSATVIGPNTLLTQGTEAMVFEHWQQGVELLEAGIKYATDPISAPPPIRISARATSRSATTTVRSSTATPRSRSTRTTGAPTTIARARSSARGGSMKP